MFFFGEKMETTQDEALAEADQSTADAATDEIEIEDSRSEDDISEGNLQVTGSRELTAVIRFAGKQFKVRSGTFFDACLQVSGDQCVIDDVLLACNGDTVLGTPTIEGAQVALTLQSTFRSQKTINFKRRRRKHSSKRTKGQRQNLSRYLVTSIDVPGLGRSEYAPAQDNQQIESPV